VAIMDLCSRRILGVTISYSTQTRTSTIETNSQTDVTDNEIWGNSVTVLDSQPATLGGGDATAIVFVLSS